MKVIYLVVACLLSSCAIEWKSLMGETSAWIENKKADDWLEYGIEIMAMDSFRLEEEREDKRSNYHPNEWQTGLELAIVLGLQPTGESDYTQAIEILDSLKEYRNIDSQTLIVINWYHGNLVKQKEIFDASEKFRKQSHDLSEKINKLSKIEKHIRSRSKQVIR